MRRVGQWSIKTRLIFNVILIHALLMGFVVFDMLEREHRFMGEQLSTKGHDLTSMLASNATQYLLNNDIIAMDELIGGMDKISDQYMFFILDQHGKVRASMPPKYFNLTLDDEVSLQLIKESQATQKSVQLHHDSFVDTLYPIDVEGRVVGYGRTLLDTQKLDHEITLINQRGVVFILLAIGLGALFAWLSVRKMTLKLQNLTHAAGKMALRDFKATLPISRGEDEVDTMIEAFGVMQDSIHRYVDELDSSQKRLNLALEGSSDGLWDWNLLSDEVYFSPRWKEMIGYGDDAFENSLTLWQNHIHPEDVTRVLDFIKAFLASDSLQYEQRFRMRTQEGQYIQILARAKKVLDVEGRAIRLIGTYVDMTAIIEAQEKLQYQATHDPLTNLPNRILFIDTLRDSLQSANRYGTKVAVFFLDLDRFKEINDSMGHSVGDQLLQQISHLLKGGVGVGDIVSRFGGDEFAIAVENIKDEKVVIDVVEKIMESINIPHKIEENIFFTTFSIGISIYPNDGLEPEILLKNADSAMYKAKKSGRNTFEFYTSDMTQQALERISLETALRHALTNRSLDVHYQPQINLDSSQIVSVEALARWEDPKLGKIPPDIFIPLAEETGLITAIDIFVMERVIDDMDQWIQGGLPIVRVALNISAIELMYGSYLETFRNKLEGSVCESKYLEFEITESQIMKDPELAINKLNYLSDMGVKLSIDDFGTGYSSLAYLKRLPIHKLKIDKSFIDDIAHNQDDREIVKTIIDMAKNIHLGVIAEGVETAEQIEYLRKCGCEEIQGYYYYKPMPKDELAKLLLNSLPRA